jgi:hypothetical protein
VSGLNLLLENVIMFLGVFGPPVFLGTAWFRRIKEKEQPAPRLRCLFRDIALVGATLDLVAIWTVPMFASSTVKGHEWDGIVVWTKLVPAFFYFSLLFLVIASLGKGKGKVFTIISCICLVFSLVAIDAMR